ncbi:YaaA family protein [Helicobacter sp. UBA3407]|uniref:YaaA family protein n=1 Tax=Helicobacter sp. UBA3407 TaxID=1946588 RepID=UPI002601DE06|nr:YaaA family protein [Helicobacter sp. UBA3407]
MWILFSPSEKKCLEHKKAQEKQGEPFYQDFICKESLEEALKAYQEFLQSAKESEIQQLFGAKHLVLEELACAQNLMESPLLPAVLRYCGIAFSALDFEHLRQESQDYLKQHLLIFSNLFGPLRAMDKIPYYDLKQGESFENKSVKFNTKQFYLKNTKKIWEYLLESASGNPKKSPKSLEILDLRAGFYQKCFNVNKLPMYLNAQESVVYEPIFVKNGKVISRYAKHYRSILLRACAIEKLECLVDLENLYLEGLELESAQRVQEDNLKRVVLTYTLKNV